MEHRAPLSRLALLFVPAVLLVAQVDHTTAFTGNWKLNVAKSMGGPDAAQSGTITIAPNGLFEVEGVTSKGKAIKWAHAWSVDKEVPIDGVENGTMITKLHGRTADDTMKIAGKIVETVHAVVSPDGKSLTATIDGLDAQGHSRHHVEVYEKQ